MIKYRIKKYVDDNGTIRYLPQYRRWFIWVSGGVSYSSYEQAKKELVLHNNKLNPKYIYLKVDLL